jgi:hypothetical protein
LALADRGPGVGHFSGARAAPPLCVPSVGNSVMSAQGGQARASLSETCLAAIVTANIGRQPTRESRTDANFPGGCAMSSDLTELARRRLLLCRGALLTVPLSSNASCSPLHSMRLYGTSFGKQMPPSAAPCSPSRISAIEARLRTSALCRHCTNSSGPLICSSPLSRPVKRCSPWQDHGQCSA